VLFHSDFVQAVGKIPFDFRAMDVDLASVSAHKFGGPKGAGFLYIKSGTYLKPICESTHEFGIRAGTENVPGIVGMSVAVEEAVKEQPELEKRLRRFRGQVWSSIKGCAPDAKVNGLPERSVVSIMNAQLPGVEGEMMVLALDREGVSISTGSACHSGSSEPSHVLSALGLNRLEALSSIRISMGHTTEQDGIDLFCGVFPGVYERVRAAAVR
jgi:cysteine desulfurase